MSNYTKFAVKGTIIILVISSLAAFLGYLVRFLLARNLTVEQFGLFYAVFAFLSLFGLFKSLGFDRALVKFVPEFQHEKRNDLIKSSIIYVALIQIITNSVTIMLVYLLSNYLSVHFFHNAQAALVLRLMAIAFFIDGFVLVLKYAFQGFQKMALYAGIDFVRMLLILTVTFIGFRLAYKIFSPVVAYIVAPLVLIFIFVPILSRTVFPEFIKSKYIFDMALFKRISKYSIFAMATNVGTFILGYTDMLVLTYFSGLKSVGLYSVALPTARVLTYLPRAIIDVVAPLTSELWVKKKEMLLRDGIELLYKYSIIVMLPLAFIMFSFSELIINVLYGESYILASTAMKILSIGMIFGTLFGINSSFFAGIGKPQINSRIVYTAAIFNLISNLIVIPIIGILGAAITNAMGYFMMMAMGLTKMIQLIKLKLPVKVWIKTSIAGVIFISTIWFLKRIIYLNVWLETAIVLSMSGMIYTALLFLLGILEISELKMLYKKIAK